MDNRRYEPGPTGNYGADGIPREGMEERYATALWRDSPSAFWLHPDGPLAETTPEEYFVPRPEPTVADRINQGYLAMGMLGGYANCYANNQAYQQQAALQYAANHQSANGLLGNLAQNALSPLSRRFPF